MLGSTYDRLLEQSKSIYSGAKQGHWENVYILLKSNLALGDHPDTDQKTPGWSLTDHAVHQGRVDVILTLRQHFKLRQSPRSCVVLNHVHNQHWPLILRLIFERILLANVIYTQPNNTRATLLDLAALNGLTEVVKLIRYRYAGKTAQELDAITATKAMFNAAIQKQWPTVFEMLAYGVVDIDSIHHLQNKTLIQYAYEQRDQEVFMKLMVQYHPCLHEIRNEDKDLYELLLEFYDQCLYEKSKAEEEQLIKQFNQALGKLDDETQTKDLLEPVSRPFIFSPLITSKRMLDTEIVGIKALVPENDEIIERKGERRVPWS
jgi:hypothetical protein